MTNCAGAVRVAKRHDDDLSPTDVVHFVADVLNHANGFVAHWLTAGRLRKVVVWPEVAPADAGARDTNDRVRWLLGDRVRNVLDRDVEGLVHNGGAHLMRFLSLGLRARPWPSAPER